MKYKDIKKIVTIISIVSSLSFIAGMIELYLNNAIEGLIFSIIGFISIVIGYVLVEKNDKKNKS